MSIAFITNEQLYHKVIEPVSQAKQFVWIGTADIKDLHVKHKGSVQSFLTVLDSLIKRKVAIEKIWSYLVESNLIAINTKYGTFNYVIKHRELPKGADKILWNKNYVDGMWLVKFFRLNVIVFNTCFTLRKGGLPDKQKNKIKKGDYSDFSRELLKYDENFIK